MKRIAFTGKLRSGKSTIAGYLTRVHEYERVSFADGLRTTADNLFKHLYEPIYGECPFTGEKEIRDYRKPRALLQELGQKMREIDEDVWIKQAEYKMRMWENFRSTKGIVIDDLRQPNEYEWARANGFIIIRVNANEDTRLERARAAGDDFDVEDLRHDTELHVDDFEADYDFWNDEESDLLAIQEHLDAMILSSASDQGEI